MAATNTGAAMSTTTAPSAPTVHALVDQMTARLTQLTRERDGVLAEYSGPDLEREDVRKTLAAYDNEIADVEKRIERQRIGQTQAALKRAADERAEAVAAANAAAAAACEALEGRLHVLDERIAAAVVELRDLIAERIEKRRGAALDLYNALRPVGLYSTGMRDLINGHNGTLTVLHEVLKSREVRTLNLVDVSTRRAERLRALLALALHELGEEA
ncbi:MAG: hypothetical protein QM702_25195 [Rubrivivax sp.]